MDQEIQNIIDRFHARNKVIYENLIVISSVMKAKNLLLVLLIGIIVIPSCKKDKTNPELSVPRILKQNIQSGQYNYIMTFQYDDSFRATKIVQLNGTYKTYDYVDTTVTVKAYNSTGTALISIETYILNSKGLAKSMLGTGSYKTTGTWSEKYEYDNNGYLTKEVFTSTLETGHTAIYSIKDGNMITEAFFYSGQYDSTFYEFSTATKNTIGNENMGLSFLGKQNINLFNLMNEKSSTHGTSPYTYTYEFDSQNRVSKLVREGEGNSTVTSTYTYVD